MEVCVAPAPSPSCWLCRGEATRSSHVFSLLQLASMALATGQGQLAYPPSQQRPKALRGGGGLGMGSIDLREKA
jgi:hypothetical protein